MRRWVSTITAATATLSPLAPPAVAADARSGAPRYAAFSGSADPRRAGAASACAEVLTNGPVTPIPCAASFELADTAQNLCTARVNHVVATFDYTSPTTGFSLLDVPLTATADGGVGYLVGSGARGSNVFNVRIAIAALCTSPQASGPFEGGLAYA